MIVLFYSSNLSPDYLESTITSFDEINLEIILPILIKDYFKILLQKQSTTKYRLFLPTYILWSLFKVGSPSLDLHLLFLFLMITFTHWVDSSKHRNDAENLTLLDNSLFPTLGYRA